MKFALTTEELNIFIEEYRQHEITIGEHFTLKDKYIPVSNNKRGSYWLILEYNGEILNTSSLFSIANKANSIAQSISLFFFYVVPYPIGQRSNYLNSYTCYLQTPKSCPRGWISNYDTVHENITRNSPITGILEVSQHPFATCDESPLIELTQVWKNFNNLEERVQYLMHLHHSFEYADETAKYLLYGKALEIVNDIYPLAKSRNNKDNRIEENWPELQNHFNGITIKHLQDLSNNRKETRHYRHMPMNSNERQYYYELANLLIWNIIRQKSGLPVQDIIYESRYELE